MYQDKKKLQKFLRNFLVSASQAIKKNALGVFFCLKDMVRRNTPVDLSHLRWLVWGDFLPCLGKEFLNFSFFIVILK